MVSVKGYKLLKFIQSHSYTAADKTPYPESADGPDIDAYIRELKCARSLVGDLVDRGCICLVSKCYSAYRLTECGRGEIEQYRRRWHEGIRSWLAVIIAFFSFLIAA